MKKERGLFLKTPAQPFVEIQDLGLRPGSLIAQIDKGF
jgi:hypothetical protein